MPSVEISWTFLPDFGIQISSLRRLVFVYEQGGAGNSRKSRFIFTLDDISIIIICPYVVIIFSNLYFHRILDPNL